MSKKNCAFPQCFFEHIINEMFLIRQTGLSAAIQQYGMAIHVYRLHSPTDLTYA